MSAQRDLKIAESTNISDVVFKFTYDALIKLGIMLIAKKGYKVRSTAGHHIKILEKLSQVPEYAADCLRMKIFLCLGIR
ncbi:MAG: hypothetical protein P9L90_02165 [Candidatus Aadella gelida]|nr:hypothetical protein [Candidatus Aadella gelida]